MTSGCDIKETIRAKALELGFDACGFARAGRVPVEVEEAYNRWIAEGKNDCMDYAAKYREVRLDPRELLPEAKTVISVAMNYYPAVKQRAGVPRFSFYAYGNDYHDVMRERLLRLAACVDENPGVKSRVCVDTAPIMEKYWAQRAGLGMIGRNRLLIIPGKGSFFFLGEVVTSLEVIPDVPCEMSCGDCMRCVKACPGGALTCDGGLDARKCLSCQLIERRGELPQWVEDKIGNRVYGCDECQMCCPHNSGARPAALPEFVPSSEFLQLSLDGLAEMSEEEFRRLFRHSAVKRVKHAGLIRNVRCVCEYGKNFDKKP